MRIIATAIACFAASPSFGQSQMTMGGVVDLRLQKLNASGTGEKLQMTDGGLNTSRIFFRGQEDLGGGQYAGFWLEGGINSQNGTGKFTYTNNQPTGFISSGGLVFDRMAFVRLGGPWGEIRLGKDYMQSHWVNILFDPFAGNGVAKDLNLTFSAAGNAPFPTAVVGSNQLSYSLPSGLGGFYATLQGGMGENSSATANQDDGNFLSMRAGYNQGSVHVGMAYSRTTYASTAQLGDYTHTNIGGVWNAGFARFMGLYNIVRVDLAGARILKNSMLVGVIIPLSPTTNLKLSAVNMDNNSSSGYLNSDGSPHRTNDARQYGIGIVHDLSKRTALYTSFAYIKNKGMASYSVDGPTPSPGKKSRGLDIGIRHTF